MMMSEAHRAAAWYVAWLMLLLLLLLLLIWATVLRLNGLRVRLDSVAQQQHLVKTQEEESQGGGASGLAK